MTKPPAGASLLFGVLADSGKIKQRKNGKFTMVLEGVDEIDWFTDRPERAEGTWKPQKLDRQWDRYFATSEPNAQVTAKSGENRQALAFEMFKPKMRSGKMIFNIKPLSDSGRDKLTGLQDEELSDVSLFIDNASAPFSCEIPAGADLTYADLNDANLTNAHLAKVNLAYAALNNANLTGAYLKGANLSQADLMYANLTEADLNNANLSNATLDDAIWNNTTCPDATNSNDPGNSGCGY